MPAALTAFQNASRSGLGLSNLHFAFREEWGSSAGGALNYRSSIREDIIRTLITHGIPVTVEHEARFRDLRHLPAHPGLAISVSHCRTLGGYAWVQRPGLLGFDIEEADRINVKTAKRVSTPEEFARAPSSALLWAAKEAGYKALAGAAHVATISEIEIFDWQSAKPQDDLWSYSTRVRIGDNAETFIARGFAGLENGLAVAVVFSEITQSG